MLGDAIVAFVLFLSLIFLGRRLYAVLRGTTHEGECGTSDRCSYCPSRHSLKNIKCRLNHETESTPDS